MAVTEQSRSPALSDALSHMGAADARDGVIDLTALRPPCEDLFVLQNEIDWSVIVEAMPHIVWLAAADGSTEYVNQRGTDYTGLAREAPYAWNWGALIHPHDFEVAPGRWQKVTHRAATATSDELYESECRIRRWDGEYRWHACRASPARRRGGAVVIWIGTATDIEERKTLEVGLIEAQRQTAESAAFLANLQRPAPVTSGLDKRELRVVRHHPESLHRTRHLTNREREVLECITRGLSNRAVGEQLDVTVNTVRNHVQRILYKLNVHTRLEAVVVATHELSA